MEVKSYNYLCRILQQKLGELYDEIKPVLDEYYEKNVRKKVNLDDLNEDIDRLIDLIVRPLVYKIVKDNTPDFLWIPFFGMDINNKIKGELETKIEEGIKQAKYYLKNDKKLRENLQNFLQEVVDRYQ
jgi:hypothetical protein